MIIQKTLIITTIVLEHILLPYKMDNLYPLIITTIVLEHYYTFVSFVRKSLIITTIVLEQRGGIGGCVTQYTL